MWRALQRPLYRPSLHVGVVLLSRVCTLPRRRRFNATACAVAVIARLIGPRLRARARHSGEGGRAAQLSLGQCSVTQSEQLLAARALCDGGGMARGVIHFAPAAAAPRAAAPAWPRRRRLRPADGGWPVDGGWPRCGGSLASHPASLPYARCVAESVSGQYPRAGALCCAYRHSRSTQGVGVSRSAWLPLKSGAPKSWLKSGAARGLLRGGVAALERFPGGGRVVAEVRHSKPGHSESYSQT